MSELDLDDPLKPQGRGRLAPAEALLLGSVFVVAACGLVYELAAGTLASYLLGDSILQFSTVIGTYLFAMGVGSWLSRFIERQLVAHFIRIELLVGLVGGLMPAALFTAHATLPLGADAPFRALLYGMILLIGVLVGLEIPLVMRILQRQFRHRYVLKDLVSEVLTFDYLGALVVSLAFPLLLVPHLGVVRTGVFFGLLNALVAVWALKVFRHELRGFVWHALACAGVALVLCAAMVGAQPLTTWAEDRFYGSGVVWRQDTPYQRIVITQNGQGTRLYLNGNLQFASPLPRGPGAPRHGRTGRAKACAGAGWWRRVGRARDPEVPLGARGVAGGAGPGHDPSVQPGAAPASLEPQGLELTQSEGAQHRCLHLVGSER